MIIKQIKVPFLLIVRWLCVGDGCFVVWIRYKYPIQKELLLPLEFFFMAYYCFISFNIKIKNYE